MAFPETCAGALDAIADSAYKSLTYSNRALTDINNALSHWNLGQDHEAIEDLIKGLSDTNTAAGYAGYGYDPFAYVGPWWYYFTNCIAGLDMDSLLNVMLEADPKQVEYFVGLVDAYRQSIWNKPFNSEFFAALARGFEQWA